MDWRVACARSVLRVAVVACVIAVAMIGSPAGAITIDISYCHENDSPFEDNNVTGKTIVALFEAAAAIWEDYLPDPGNPPFTGVYDICVSWDDDLGDDTVGNADTVSFDIDLLADPLNAGTLTAPADWYIDETPFDNSEFKMKRFEAREYSGPEIQDYFNGSVQPLLESGYFGDAKDDEAADGKIDALTIALHEMGHILGVNSLSGDTWNAPISKTGGVLTVIDNLDDDDSHIAATKALMFSEFMESMRVLPSSVDILAVADDEAFGFVDLPRQAFLLVQTNENDPAINWHIGPFVWEGGAVPGTDDQARITNGARVSLQGGNVQIESLVISNDSELDTLGNTMTVSGLTEVSGTSASKIVVSSGGELSTQELEITGGSLELDGGTVAVAQKIIAIGDPSQLSFITGNGTVSAAQGMTLFGLIEAVAGATGTLHLTTVSTDPAWTFGVSPGEAALRAVDGDLLITGKLNGPTPASMAVSGGHSLTFTEPWTQFPNGVLFLNGSPDGTMGAVLAGAVVAFNGDVLVNKRGDIFTAKVIFANIAHVSVPDFNDRLKLFTPTVFSGATFSGDGTIEQIGNAMVESNTTIGTGIYDWDGAEADPSDTVINPGVTFIINSPLIDLFSSDGYDGETEVGGGTLVVNTSKFDEKLGEVVEAPWSLDPGGRINLIHGNIITEGESGLSASIKGSPIDVHGTIFANGPGNVIDSETTFFPTANVQLFDADTHLFLMKQIEYRGGTYTGDGTLHQYGDASTQSTVKIEVKTYDWDGSEAGHSITTILSTGRFDIIAQAIDETDSDGFDGLVQMNNGTLVVQTGDFSGVTPVFTSWSLDPSAHLNMFNGSVVAGNHTSISSANGSEMVVKGRVSATGLGNKIYSPTTFKATALVEVAIGGDELTLAGPTTYEGGSFTGSGVLIQEGHAVVNAATTSSVATFDFDGASETTNFTLHSDSTLDVERIDTSGPPLRFDGMINVASRSVLMVNTSDMWEMAGGLDVGPNLDAGPNDPAFRIGGEAVKVTGNVQVQTGSTLVFEWKVEGTGNFTGPGTVVFENEYSPGASPGETSFGGSVIFAPSAALKIEIQGTNDLGKPTRSDQIHVTADVSLNGTLNIILLDGFVPDFGDTFSIVTADKIIGTFDQINGVLPGGKNYALAPIYNYKESTGLTLVTALPGDVTLDGKVGIDDLITLLNNAGTDSDWIEGDITGDRNVTLDDLLILLNNAGASELPSMLAAVNASSFSTSVPEPTTAMLVTFLSCMMLRRSR